MIKNLIRLDEFLSYISALEIVQLIIEGPGLGKKYFFLFWGKLNRLYETRVIVTRSEKNFV